MRYLLLILIFSSSLFCAESVKREHVLFLLSSQKIDPAISLYYKYVAESGKHDFDILEKMGLEILKEGAESPNVETKLLTMYGASIAKISPPLHILEEGLTSDNPYVQAAVIGLLAEMQDDGADEALLKAFTSPYLMIRLETAYALASRRYRHAFGHIESLMQKLPGELWTFFPELYAQIGTKEAIALLKSLMNHDKMSVRLASIYSAAKYERDDLLPTIRSIATHLNPAEQEICAFALGLFRDIKSKPLLERLSKSNDLSVQLSALSALKELGDESALGQIEKLASEKNLFAITLLSKYESESALLIKLMQDNDFDVRLNATLALLKRGDARAIGGLGELLIKTQADLGFETSSSAGATLKAFHAKALLTQRAKKDKEQLIALSEAFRGHVLRECIELDESLFLLIARKIFDYRQINLVPMLVQLLENKKSPASIALLKEMSQAAGAPLIRTYCHLSLYRLGEAGFSEKALFDFVENERGENLLRLRPLISWGRKKKPASIYQLTPEETSHLLIQIYETLASKHDEKSIDQILSAIKEGNPKNRYALAGLLLLAIQ